VLGAETAGSTHNGEGSSEVDRARARRRWVTAGCTSTNKSRDCGAFIERICGGSCATVLGAARYKFRLQGIQGAVCMQKEWCCSRKVQDLVAAGVHEQEGLLLFVDCSVRESGQAGGSLQKCSGWLIGGREAIGCRPAVGLCCGLVLLLTTQFREGRIRSERCEKLKGSKI
jgi:hypothetical protein